MILKARFNQLVWSLIDPQMAAEADATLSDVYGNLHRYQVEDDDFFGMNGEVFLRFSYYELEGKNKKGTKIVIHTNVFDILNRDGNKEYVDLMNKILGGEGQILSVFDYPFEKTNVLYRVVRWEEKKIEVVKEEGIEPTKVVRPDNRKHGQKGSNARAEKGS